MIIADENKLRKVNMKVSKSIILPMPHQLKFFVLSMKNFEKLNIQQESWLIVIFFSL